MAPKSFFSAGSYIYAFYFAALASAQASCTLSVPANPLTALGLATPYQVTGCNQRQFADQGSFVEAAIFDPATNTITLYHPLVVNQGDVPGKDFIPPLPVTVPSGATVGIWFGTNAGTLTLAGPGKAACVNGLPNSVFGQFAYCNGDVFMQTALAAVAAGTLTPPPLGTGKSGTCPTTRDFRMVDMDQSDNVDTTYLLINNHILAQATPAASKNNTKAQVLSNGSDNALLDVFLDPTLGCTPWMVTSPTAATGMSPGLSLNEIMANQFQQNPALVPENDPMVTVTNNAGTVQPNLQKVNLYRAGVGQTPANTLADASANTYCQNFAISGIFIAQNQGLFSNAMSPAPAVATNLFTFMAQRFAASFAAAPALGCMTIFGLQNNPVNLTMNGNCVVTAATINTAVLQNILNGNVKPVAAFNAPPATTSTTAAAATSTTTTRRQKGGFSMNNPFGASSAGAAPTDTAAAAAAAATTTAGTTTAAAQTTTAPNFGGNGGSSFGGGFGGPFRTFRRERRNLFVL